MDPLAMRPALSWALSATSGRGRPTDAYLSALELSTTAPLYLVSISTAYQNMFFLYILALRFKSNRTYKGVACLPLKLMVP